jgi:hypothetical protein
MLKMLIAMSDVEMSRIKRNVIVYVKPVIHNYPEDSLRGFALML